MKLSLISLQSLISSTMNKEFITFVLVTLMAMCAIFSLKPADAKLEQFENFKTKFGKFYMTAEEEEYRKSVFLMNLLKIQTHNADKTQTYTLGVTQFADLTEKEFTATYLQAKVNEEVTNDIHARSYREPENLGDVDWTVEKKVSPVKNQGACGSCWAFSATGAIESKLMINGKNQLISQQQLVDCSTSYGNHGCNGGWMDSAFQYVKDKGIKTEGEYPYVGRNQNCAAPDGGSIKITGYVDVPSCANLENALRGQPISVAVDASNWSLYSSGVFSNCATNVNHGVLAVGVTGSYWKIKNSWGNTWGEQGFIRLAKGNTCAVCNYPSYPTV